VDGHDDGDLLERVRSLSAAGRHRELVDLLRSTPGRSADLDAALALALLGLDDPTDQRDGVELATRLVDAPDLTGGRRAELARAVALHLVLPSTASPADLAEAERWLERSTAFLPEGQVDLASLSLVRLRQGRFDEAFGLAHQLDTSPEGTLSPPQRAVSLSLEALAQAGRGQVSNATALEAQVRELDPGSRFLPELDAALHGQHALDLVCERHPGRPAGARCGRCNRPMCPDCMVEAPVGWQCRECVRAGARKSPTVRYQPRAAGQFGGTRITPVTLGLIIANVICFVLTRGGKLVYVNRFGMISPHTHHELYRLITSAFIHLSFFHIALNMFSLYIVGPPVEQLVGKIRFLALYLLSALGGSVAWYLIAPVNVVGAGASGAIFGLFGAFFVLARRNRWNTTPIVTIIVINLVYGFVVPGIGWQAHVGGLIVGSVVAFGYRLDRREPAARRWLVDIGTCVAVLGAMALLLQVPVRPAV